MIERVEVVPWSTTRTCPVMGAIPAQMQRGRALGPTQFAT
jgi:hypothetical protein